VAGAGHVIPGKGTDGLERFPVGSQKEVSLLPFGSPEDLDAKVSRRLAVAGNPGFSK
jgi:hypothetical protein